MGPQRYASMSVHNGAFLPGSKTLPVTETPPDRKTRAYAKQWSGRGDSNPRLQLGKLSYYPYTTAAQNSQFIAWACGRDKIAGCAPRRRASA